MNLTCRGAIYAGLLAPLAALGLAAQNPPTSNFSNSTDAVIPAVIQLLAVGPGSEGQNQECSGTGFLVNEEGYILTNAHVMQKGRECLAQSPGTKMVARIAAARGAHSPAPSHDGPRSGAESGPAVECDVVALDELHDLAVIKADHPLRAPDPGGAVPYVRLDSVDVPSGSRVKVTGHPTFAWVAQTQGGEVLGRKSRALFEGSTEQTEMLVLNFSLKYGSSGSPVYRAASGGVVARTYGCPEGAVTVKTHAGVQR